MRYIQGEDRRQEQLLPARVEDYVAAGAPVRVIDAFVEQLDLAALGFLAPPAATGRSRRAARRITRRRCSNAMSTAIYSAFAPAAAWKRKASATSKRSG
jgi:hypothetical protein